MASAPDRLLRNGRPIDNVFASAEHLYYRFCKRSIARGPDEGQFYIQFRIPDTSVNRSKPDGDPNDVLLDQWPKYKDWGILDFEVRQIPTRDESPGRDPINYRVQHDPLDHNYYHSEIRAFRDQGKRLQNLKHKAKTRFRMELSRRVRLLEKPSV